MVEFTQIQIKKEDRKEIRKIAVELDIKTHQAVEFLIKFYKDNK